MEAYAVTRASQLIPITAGGRRQNWHMLMQPSVYYWPYPSPLGGSRHLRDHHSQLVWPRVAQAGRARLCT